jgi:hypothetical protein
LQKGGHRLHLFGLQVLDDAVHNGRGTQLSLNHLQLPDHIGRVLPGEPWKDRSTLGILAVAARALFNQSRKSLGKPTAPCIREQSYLTAKEQNACK